ncbi:phage tail protein [Candidatus Poribacteria bacterium]|nr:phage tail protein [Candidatus Poribacteria bacterium]
MAQVYSTIDGDNLSGIISAFYGKINNEILQLVLSANQNLADVPLVFSPGTQIILPDLEESASVPVETLWD